MESGRSQTQMADLGSPCSSPLRNMPLYLYFPGGGECLGNDRKQSRGGRGLRRALSAHEADPHQVTWDLEGTARVMSASAPVLPTPAGWSEPVQPPGPSSAAGHPTKHPSNPTRAEGVPSSVLTAPLLGPHLTQEPSPPFPGLCTLLSARFLPIIL